MVDKELARKQSKAIDPLSSLGQIQKLQSLLKEESARKYYCKHKHYIISQTVQHNKERLMRQLHTNTIQLYKNKVEIKQTYDFNNNTSKDLIIENYNLNVSIEKEINCYGVIKELLLELRNSNYSMLQIIKGCNKDNYAELAHFICHFFYENIFSASLIQDDLLMLIYLLIEEELDKVDKPSDVANFLENDFLSYLFLSLTRKEDIRSYLSLILNDVILEIENNMFTKMTFNLTELENSIEEYKKEEKQNTSSSLTDSIIRQNNKTTLSLSLSNEIELVAEETLRNTINKKLNNNRNQVLIEISEENNENSVTQQYLQDALKNETNELFKRFILSQMVILDDSKNVNYFSNLHFIDNLIKISKTEETLVLLKTYSDNLKILIDFLFKKLTSHSTSVPYFIKCIINIIDTLLSEKELKPIEKYPFISKFFFNKLIVPILLTPEYNGIITTNIISLGTRENLKVLEKLIMKASEGNLFRSTIEEEKDYTIFNSYLIEFIPKVMNHILANTSRKIPMIIQKLIEEKDEIGRNIEYDFFKENKYENIQHQAICFSFSNVLIFLMIIKSNKAKFEACLFKDLLTKLLSNSSEIIRQLSHISNPNVKQFFYVSNLRFRPEFEMKLKEKQSKFCFDTNKPKSKINTNVLSRVKYCLSTIVQNVNEINKSSFDIEENNSMERFVYKLNKTMKLEGISEFKIGARIPLSWYGMFLELNIKNIPNEYKANNYSLLYEELIKETEKSIEEMKNDIINQLYLKIKTSEKLNMIFYSNLVKVRQIKKIINIEKFVERTRILVKMRQNKNKAKEIRGITITKIPPSTWKVSHDQCDTITKFIELFPNFSKKYMNKGDLIEFLKEAKVVEELNNYFTTIKELLASDSCFSGYSHDELFDTGQDITNYIQSKLHNKIYPTEPTKEDIEFYDKCERLSFIKSQNILKNKKVINEKLWSKAMDYINQMDNEKTPVDKLKAFNKAYSIIENSIAFCTGKGELGVDDNIPVLMYIVIKAKPKRIHSNLQYSKAFIDPELSVKNYGLLLSQLEMVLEVIISLKYSDLIGVTKEEFNKEDDLI